MTRHPSARRVHRPPTEPDDAFVAGVFETTAWAQKHRRTLTIGGTAAVVVIIGFVLTMNWRGTKRVEAARRITEVRAVTMSGNNQLAIRDLEQFLSAYGGTPSANEARLLLAQAYIAEGQSERAMATVRDLAANLDQVVGVNAAFLLGAAYEGAGESQRAEEAYTRIGENARFLYQRQEGFDNAARVRMQRGDAAGATQIYDRILEITPETDQNRPVYELRVGEARAQAMAGNVPATTTGG